MAETEHQVDFDPAGRSDLYRTFEGAWTLCRDFAEMHEHILREAENQLRK